MTSTITTIIAAGIAVLGTLLSPLLVTYANTRAKAQEYELARLQRLEEREAEKRSKDFIELRSTYQELNSEMRRCLRALSNYLHLIRSDRCGDQARDALDAVRHEYLQHYADAQMIIPEEVFAAAIFANNGLSRLYGMVRRLDGLTILDLNSRTTIDNERVETIDSVSSYLEEVRSRIWNLRRVMRTDLGINSSPTTTRDLDSGVDA
jgi:hypothetical protein